MGHGDGGAQGAADHGTSRGTWFVLQCAACVVTAVQVEGGVTSVAISRDSGRAAGRGGVAGQVVGLLDVPGWVPIEELTEHEGGVCSMASTPDGKGLVSGSLDQTLKHWDLTAEQPGAHIATANGVATAN